MKRTSRLLLQRAIERMIPNCDAINCKARAVMGGCNDCGWKLGSGCTLIIVYQNEIVFEQEHKYDDIRVRKVSGLGDRAKKTAIKMGLKENDLVIVKTIINKGIPPTYELEKIEGSPIDFLQRRLITNKKSDKAKTHGWTGQESKCDYAGWWDCLFFCNLKSQVIKNGKLTGELGKEGVQVCPMATPDWGRCELNKGGKRITYAPIKKKKK